MYCEIRRSDVAALLDAVEDKHGAWVADEVLAVLGSVSSWFASRNDNYAPPFVKGMRRVPAQARKRSRILNDGELKRVWKAAEQAGSFGEPFSPEDMPIDFVIHTPGGLVLAAMQIARVWRHIRPK
jgi:hypothetical protein